MPKFKAGDLVVFTDDSSIYDRRVIGYTAAGEVVYEYRANGGTVLSRRQEDVLKLKPVKKEGYIGIMLNAEGRRWETGVQDTKREVQSLTDKLTSKLIAIGTVTWEE